MAVQDWGESNMVTQKHHFISDEEVHVFERIFFQFLMRVEDDLRRRDDCLFLSHQRGRRRQTVTVQSTSTTLLDAFNSHLHDSAATDQDRERVC